MGVRDPYDRLIGDPHNFIVDPQIFIGNPKLFVLNPKFSLEINPRFSIETPVFHRENLFEIAAVNLSYVETQT